MYQICVYLLTFVSISVCCSNIRALEAEKSAENTGSQTESKPSKSQKDLIQIILNMGKSYSSVKDYSAIFLKQERIKNKLSEMETIKVYFKKPFNLYMEWIKEPNEGRQVVYRKGYNDDKLRVKARILGVNRTLTLEPASRLAMVDNRHNITEMGLGFLIEMVLENFKKAQKSNELKLVYHGESELYERTIYKVEGILPKDKDKGYYCYRAVLGIDKQNGLPILFEAYMWDDLLYERYVYSELKLNISIEDKIFESLKD